MKMANKYSEYFRIDKDFYRCIDIEAVRNTPSLWEKTYPHPTFIHLLKSAERMLAGSRQPIWIHGAYGTGKSQCAYALKKILDVPEEELRAYWAKFDVLQDGANKDLLEKLIGHKGCKVVTAYRYASGGINGTRDLLLAVQDSVKAAIEEAGVPYQGEMTLKDSVVAWLSDDLNKKHFEEYLALPEFSSRFTQSTADEVLSDLRKGGELKELMENIFYLSDRRGITAFDLNTDRLMGWLKYIIDKNDMKIVLVWDEFSSFFMNNRASLDEFQKLASLAQGTAFYFCIVTHQTNSVITNREDQAWKVVRQRYDFVEITLPDSIAFDLIASALDVVPETQAAWNRVADELVNSYTKESRDAVVKQIEKTDHTHKVNPDVFKKIMPIHPFAAMVLKYIASAFEANQRSMFDFIKTGDADVHAFQWFIVHTSPEDERMLFTVDLLWDFFYEKGRGNLTPDIQAIMDTYPRQTGLQPKEESVLKAILILQAIDQRTGGTVDLFHVTPVNLFYAFEGVRDLEGRKSAEYIAEKLVRDGILYKRPIGNGVEVYAAAALAGDQRKIDKCKNDVRSSATSAKLVAYGGLASALPLTPALKLRYGIAPTDGGITPVTPGDFTKTINTLRDRQPGWRFLAVVAFAKEDGEVAAFRQAIKDAASNPDYGHILFIDALSTPLGADAFEQYVEFSAMALYYSGNDNNLSKNNDEKARRILDTDWKGRIENGPLLVYSNENPEGERFPNANGVLGAMQERVVRRFPYVFDFHGGLTETMLKLTQAKAAAKHGCMQTSGGVVVGIEKRTLALAPGNVWHVDRYWEAPGLAALPVSRIKAAIEGKIADAFEREGQISIRELYDTLETDFGFSQCNLSAFLAGFLLKEYGKEPYRYGDSQNGHEAMSPDKLAEMLANYIGNPNPARYKDTWIVKMSPEEMAFYALTEKAFGIPENACATPGQAASEVEKRMRALGLPVWVLSEVDRDGIYEMVEKYIQLVQKEGRDTHAIALELGKASQDRPGLGEVLGGFLTQENCQKAMLAFLGTFEGGRILALAKGIHGEATLMDDIRSLFSVERSCLWERSTGENEIRKLLTQYCLIQESNDVLSGSAASRGACFDAWREKLKCIHIPAQQLREKLPDMAGLLSWLTKVYKGEEILPEGLRSFLGELQTHGGQMADLLRDEKPLFFEVYADYLYDLDMDDFDEIAAMLPFGMFVFSTSDCNIRVRDKAEEYRQNQKRVQLMERWRSATGTKNPKEWSARHRVPILCMVADGDYDQGRKVFETLNALRPSEGEVDGALVYLGNATFLEDLKSDEARTQAFRKHIIGSYDGILTDAAWVQERLERLSIEPYDWYGHPTVQGEVKRLAEAQYRAGGSDKALSILSQMTADAREAYIRRLVTDNVQVGMEIIAASGKQ
ncbi:MAG: hypothetical protein LBR77_08740 [Lachnospiraceae bacterium]|jgi:hypothetical protein|nr:hypothetical protein [Lachnospiraceae bacterium]